MSTRITLVATLRSINEYSQLVFLVDKDEVTKLDSAKQIEGNSPLWKYTVNDEERFSLKVALAPHDKHVARNFKVVAAMVGKKVKFTVDICKYSFKKQDDEIVGWRAVLTSRLIEQ